MPSWLSVEVAVSGASPIYVYAVKFPSGKTCYFGCPSTANAYARETGVVEFVSIPARDFKVVDIEAKDSHQHASKSQLSTDLAEALAVIGEHLAAHEAKFPPAEDGQQAQDAWAQRIADADNTARSVLSKHAKGG